MQSLVKTFELCDLPVRVAKFVARKHWIVAGSVRIFKYFSDKNGVISPIKTAIIKSIFLNYYHIVHHCLFLKFLSLTGLNVNFLIMLQNCCNNMVVAKFTISLCLCAPLKVMHTFESFCLPTG